MENSCLQQGTHRSWLAGFSHQMELHHLSMADCLLPCLITTGQTWRQRLKLSWQLEVVKLQAEWSRWTTVHVTPQKKVIMSNYLHTAPSTPQETPIQEWKMMETCLFIDDKSLWNMVIFQFANCQWPVIHINKSHASLSSSIFVTIFIFIPYSAVWWEVPWASLRDPCPGRWLSGQRPGPWAALPPLPSLRNWILRGERRFFWSMHHGFFGD